MMYLIKYNTGKYVNMLSSYLFKCLCVLLNVAPTVSSLTATHIVVRFNQRTFQTCLKK